MTSISKMNAVGVFSTSLGGVDAVGGVFEEAEIGGEESFVEEGGEEVQEFFVPDLFQCGFCVWVFGRSFTLLILIHPPILLHPRKQPPK